MTLQSLMGNIPIVDPQTGQPTEYFLRALRDSRVFSEDTGELAEEAGSAADSAATAAATAQSTADGAASTAAANASAIAALDLNALTDVDTDTTPATDGQALVWDETASLWLPGDVASGGGGGGVFKGARATLTNAVISTSGSWQIVPLDSEIKDTDGFLDLATNNRFTIPAGVDVIRFYVSVWKDSTDTVTNDQFKLFKNGSIMSDSDGTFNLEVDEDGYNNSGISGVSAALDVVEGDYFDLRVYVGDSAQFDGWIELAVLEGSILGGGGGAGVSNLSYDIDGASYTPLTLTLEDGDYVAAGWSLNGLTPGTVDLVDTASGSGIIDTTTKPGSILCQPKGTDVTLSKAGTLADGDCIVMKAVITNAAFTANNHARIGIGFSSSATNVSATNYTWLYWDGGDGEFVRTFGLGQGGSVFQTASPGNLYLRLQRKGTRLYGFFSKDGQSWSPVGYTDFSATNTFCHLMVGGVAPTTGYPAPIQCIEWVRHVTPVGYHPF